MAQQAEDDKVLDQVLRSFTKSMRHGIEVQVLLDDGTLLEVDLSFDLAMTKLVLRVRDVEREIYLEDIEQVCGPDEAQAACVTNREHLNPRCATVVMSSTHFLSFVFDSQRHREYFQTCLSAIIISYRQRMFKEQGHDGALFSARSGGKYSARGNYSARGDFRGAGF